jgi:hypothetical protein
MTEAIIGVIALVALLLLLVHRLELRLQAKIDRGEDLASKQAAGGRSTDDQCAWDDTGRSTKEWWDWWAPGWGMFNQRRNDD